MSRKAKLFIVITYGLSFFLAGIFYFAGGRLNTTAGYVMAIVYMYMPLLGTLIVQKGIYGQSIIKALGINFKINRWWLAAVLLPIVIALLTMIVSILFPGVTFSPGMEGMIERYQDILSPEIIAELEQLELGLSFLLLQLVQVIVAAVTINNLAAFGEELGWRGVLHTEFDKMGFWRKSVYIGIIWGLWHTPLIIQGHNYPNYPLWGVLMMVVFTVLYSPLFTYLRELSDSVIGASILHGAVNGSIGFSIMFVSGGNELLVGGTGLAGFIVLIFVNIGIYFHRRKHLGKK